MRSAFPPTYTSMVSRRKKVVNMVKHARTIRNIADRPALVLTDLEPLEDCQVTDKPGPKIGSKHELT
jgi:hypothetical protein